MSEHTKRIAIVTGATSGIGEATARKLVTEGICVIGNGRNVEKLASLETELGANFYGIAGDITQEGVIESLFDAAQNQFGKHPDIVVANAGRGLGGSVIDSDLAEFQKVLQINVTSTLALLQKSAQLMTTFQPDLFPDKAADIIIIGSVVGRNISPFSAVYGATKFAVHALAEGLRREVGPKGIRVSLVEPGILLSGFQEVAGYSDATVSTFTEKWGPLLIGKDIADTIHFMVNQPPHVHISEIMVRPTRQDYP
ncbi:MAG: SDR family oxidoreductase [Methylococcales bacterium]